MNLYTFFSLLCTITVNLILFWLTRISAWFRLMRLYCIVVQFDNWSSNTETFFSQRNKTQFKSISKGIITILKTTILNEFLWKEVFYVCFLNWRLYTFSTSISEIVKFTFRKKLIYFQKMLHQFWRWLKYIFEKINLIMENNILPILFFYLFFFHLYCISPIFLLL